MGVTRHVAGSTTGRTTLSTAHNDVTTASSWQRTILYARTPVLTVPQYHLSRQSRLVEAAATFHCLAGLQRMYLPTSFDVLVLGAKEETRPLGIAVAIRPFKTTMSTEASDSLTSRYPPTLQCSLLQL